MRLARRCECVVRLGNTLRRWAKLPPLFPRRYHSTICPITDHNLNLRPLAVIHASPNVERATLLRRILKTACFALARREFPSDNVDAEILVGKLRIKSNRSRPAVQRGVARPAGALRIKGSEGLSALRANLLPVTERG